MSLRDEVYAHSDKASLGSDENYAYPSKDSIFKLIELVKEIIVHLYKNVFDKCLDLDNPFEISKEITDIFKRLEEFENIQNRQLITEINSSKID